MKSNEDISSSSNGKNSPVNRYFLLLNSETITESPEILSLVLILTIPKAVIEGDFSHI